MSALRRALARWRARRADARSILDWQAAVEAQRRMT